MAGVFTGVIVSLFIIRFFNKNHSFRTEYDEMQKKVRGEAYMYGFYALIIYEALLAFAETVISIPADPLVLHFSGILLGVGVQAGYSIWNDAYVGLNTQTNRFLIIMIVIGGVNLLVSAIAVIDGRMFVNGILQPPFCNLLVFFLFLILGIIGVIKRAGKKEDES